MPKTPLYSQTIARKKLNPLLSVFVVIALAVSAFFIMSFLMYAGRQLGLDFVQYVLFAALVALATRLLYVNLSDYHYALYDGELLLEKRTGRRTSRLELIEIGSIERIETYDKQNLSPNKDETLYFAYRPYAGAMVLRVRVDSGYAIVFSPDEELARRLSEAVERKRDEHGQKDDGGD